IIDLKKISPDSANFHIILRDLLAGIAYHEFGHSKECPIHNENFSILIQAVSTALEQNQKYNSKSLLYIVNIFSDLIVNTCFGLQEDNYFFRNSKFMFHYSELVLYGTIDLLYSYFILLNLNLYQFHKPIRTTLIEFILPNLPKDYHIKLRELLEIFCPFTEISDKMMKGIKLNENERWKVINFLSETQNWDSMSYEFTRNIIDLIPDPVLLEHQPVPNSIFTKKFKEDASYRNEILEKILNRKMKKESEEDLKIEIQSSKIKKQSKKPKKNKNKVKIKLKSDSKSEKKERKREKYPGEKNLSYGFASFDSIEFLDALYKYRIKNMEIKIPKLKNEKSLPIGWLNREILTENDNLFDFDPMMVYFLPGSDDLLIYKKSVPITIDERASDREGGFPNLAIFCDDSGSMDWNPLSGAGKYDAVLVTLYSLFEWLQKHQFAASIEYNITCFSNTTRSSGWLNYFNLNNILPIIFRPERGGTQINVKKFKDIINYPKEKVVIIITDGEIFNHKELKKELKRNRNNINLLFVQIDSMSKMAEELKEMGFSVVQIKDISKLSVIILDFVKKSYKS
ncbi:MAG: hypothetical protein ACTSVV_19565, partial [Promethearchaeota archaeon]